MTNSIDKMRDCPKFDNCSAPICPLDPNWQRRIHRKGEPVCFYLLEYVKPSARARFQGCMAMPIYKVIEWSIDALCDRYAPLRTVLERAKRTGSRMKAPRKPRQQIAPQASEDNRDDRSDGTAPTRGDIRQGRVIAYDRACRGR